MSRWRSDADYSSATPDTTVDFASGRGSARGASSPIHDGCHIVTARLPGGGHMDLKVPTGDDIGDRIAASSLPYETVNLTIVDAFLPRNPSIIDVGANVGNHAIYWALTHHARVTAFEPYAPAQQLLDANIARNGVGHLIEVHHLALGAGPGTATPQPRPGNLGATRLRTARAGQIPVAALDTLRPTHLDLLKIDVEGDEMGVLEGASHLLDALRPIVWVEVLSHADRTATQELMGGHGYRVMAMLSPTNALFLPRWKSVLRLAVRPRSMYPYVRRSLGQRVRHLRAHPRLAQPRGGAVKPGRRPGWPQRPGPQASPS